MLNPRAISQPFTRRASGSPRLRPDARSARGYGFLTRPKPRLRWATLTPRVRRGRRVAIDRDAPKHRRASAQGGIRSTRHEACNIPPMPWRFPRHPEGATASAGLAIPALDRYGENVTAAHPQWPDDRAAYSQPLWRSVACKTTLTRSDPNTRIRRWMRLISPAPSRL